MWIIIGNYALEIAERNIECLWRKHQLSRDNITLAASLIRMHALPALNGLP